MNVEKAIEHLLQLHAAAEGRMDKVERQLGAMSNLMRTGIKLVINTRDAQKTAEFKINALIDAGQRTDQRLAELAKAQTITERKLASFIDALKKNKTNGHN